MKKQWIKGTVRWFDNLKGQGFIRCNEDDICYFIHYSAIQSKEAWKTLYKNEPVKFQLHEDYTWTHVSKLKMDDEFEFDLTIEDYEEILGEKFKC